jgi:L-threonylcarbamoyladenylate synthase
VGEARRVVIDPGAPAPAVLRRIARLLREGEVVGAPSDTVYGFLALPRQARARETVSRLKGRSGPFLVLVATWEQVRTRTRELPEPLPSRLRDVWPGPVTVILPARPRTPGAVGGTLGLRMPDSVFLRALLEEVGEPLLSTSANRPGQPPLLRAEDVEAEFPELPLVVDGGPSASPEPSAVVDLTQFPPRILRAGRGGGAALLDPPTSPP